MIWFILLCVAFFVPFCVFAFNVRRQNNVAATVFGLLMSAVGVVAFVSLNVSCGLPEGYKEQRVLEVTEDGVVKESSVTYYEDENGDFYIETDSENAFWRACVKPFCKRTFEKVKPPVFESGGFITDHNCCSDCVACISNKMVCLKGE